MSKLEIDFLPVNSKGKSGDCITLRYTKTDSWNDQKVITIDGGTLESGDNLIGHLEKYYNTNKIDLAILTHPDGDHASGMRRIIENCTVKKIWMHEPWEHSERIRKKFQDGRITDNSLNERIKNAYNFAKEISEMAEEKDITIVHPFSGTSFDDVLRVISPSKSYYESLLPNFSRTPEPKERTIMEKTFSTLEKAINWVKETLTYETLDEEGKTSFENMSSVISMLQLDGRRYLFTGDAGMEAFHKGIEYCNDKLIDISYVNLLQVPHHGSKRNISPSILDTIKCRSAFISASKDSDKHPSRKVTNALYRRDAKVFTTEGSILRHHYNAGEREGFSNANPLPFYNEVQE